jgi:poly(hydroxyalkanoate) granule-associated protein
MAEKKTIQDQVKETAVDVRNEAIVQTANLYLLARKVLLAGFGAVALTVEEAQAFLDKLVERGEIAETDAQELIKEFRSRAKEQELGKAAEKVTGRVAKVTEKPAKAAKAAEEAVEERITAILREMNVPTKADIDALSNKISELSKKIDALKKQK